MVTLCLTVAQSASPGQQFSATQPESFDQLARQVERQLDSTDPRSVAWGAYSAGVYQLTSAVPVLQRILGSPPATTAPERRALLDAVLDALIQLNAHLPASLVVRYVDERPVHTLVLLTNAVDRAPVLLNLLTMTSGMQWYGVANVLLRDKTPGLAIHLLATLHLHITITVSDGDQGLGVGSGLGASVGDGIGENPAGYPPRALYRFEPAPYTGAIVLATGPHTVYYSRTLTTAFQYGVSEVGIGGPGDDDRIAYLQAMLGPADRSTLRAETSTSIRWSTAAALIQRVTELRADSERQYRLLLGTLVRSARLTNDAAATLPPHIDVRLVDQRRNQSVALPTVPR